MYNTIFYKELAEGDGLKKGLYVVSYKEDKIGGGFPVVGKIGEKEGISIRGYKTNTLSKAEWFRKSTSKKEAGIWRGKTELVDVNAKLNKEVIGVAELLRFFCSEGFLTADEVMELGM